jgi:hypothetical protein
MHSFRSGAHTEYSTDIILCVVINQVVQGELLKGGIRSDKCIRNYTHVDTKLHIYRVRFILDQQWGFLHSYTGGCIFFWIFSTLCLFKCHSLVPWLPLSKPENSIVRNQAEQRYTHVAWHYINRR